MLIVIHADGTVESTPAEVEDDHLGDSAEEVQPGGYVAPGLAVVGD